jgi:hypothetical protein
MLEDGLSWPVLLSLYGPARYDASSELAWLRRTPDPAVPAKPGPLILDRFAALNESLALPPSEAALWATIDIKPSMSGRVAAALLRAPPLQITLHFMDGHSQGYRFIPAIVRGGFMLSPFVGSTLDFLKLRAGDGQDQPDPKRPAAVSLDIPASDAWAWRKSFRIRISTLTIPAWHAPLLVSGTPPLANHAAADSDTPRNACFADEANGSPVTAAPIRGRWPIRLSGWALFDPSTAQPADYIEIAAQAGNGTLWATPAATNLRPDLGRIYQLPETARPGFTATLNTTDLPPGHYTTAALVHHRQVTLACRLSLTLEVPPR